MSRSRPDAVNPSSQSHSENYRGKNLFFLLLAMAAPAALLYLRLVFGYIASEGSVSRNQLGWLTVLSNVALALFFVVQLICARRIQRLLKPRLTLPGIALQYVAVLLLCVLISVTGAVLLEGFGYNFFLRVRNARAR